MPVERRDLRTSVIVGLCCLLIYNANGRAISAGDALPARYLPFAIWRHATLTLDPVERLVTQGRARRGTGQPAGDVAFWTVTTPSGQLVSLYPVVLPILIAPLYLPAVAYVQLRGWTESRVDHVARLMEKISASLVAAVSASLLYLLLRRRAAPPDAMLLTVAYAFGTTTWVISSQALWQHGMAELLLVGLLLCLTAPCTVPLAVMAGALCGLVAGNRPPDAILAAALGLHGLFWAGRRALVFAAAAAVPAALVLLYNVSVTGAIGGAYGQVGTLGFFGRHLASGLAGLLFSPTRGLLIFSPFLAFLVLAWRHRSTVGRDRGLAIAIMAGIAVQVALYAAIDWRGGIAWGPRFMTDILPLLVWLLVPVVVALRGVGRVAFVTAVAIAVAIEGVGAFTYTGYSDRPVVAGGGADRFRAAWDWANAPFVAGLSTGVAPPELVLRRRGTIDRFEVAGQHTDVVPAGQDAVAVGWSLIGRRTPLQVGIAIDDAAPITTRDFSDRADVRATLPEAGPAGWRVPLPTAALPPGEHQLTVYTWADEAGEATLLMRRPLMVQASRTDLDAAFSTAAMRIRDHQQAPGFWLTAFTNGTRFERPQAEMNTYLTSLLVDLLDPLSAASGLGDSVARARHHLTAQIESTGLVRYHGLPDAPGIGTLGCSITPDTDDTALVWRIAPGPDRGRMPAALATIAAYRRDDGLYRTWLAPRDRFQCLDPGRDPNPADVAIQIHLLQWLVIADPPAGRALCEALRARIGDEAIWVYYQRTPLVPILRQPDLARAGCAIEMPEARTRTNVPGQDVWVSVARHLARVGSSPATPTDRAEVEALLRRLSTDDFALLRANPPLLYHNDLTATVARFYWSEDVGYALWLRLAHDHAHIGRSKPGA